MEIRLAKEQEFSVVRQFYHSLIDAMEGKSLHGKSFPQDWQKSKK